MMPSHMSLESPLSPDLLPTFSAPSLPIVAVFSDNSPKLSIYRNLGFFLGCFFQILPLPAHYSDPKLLPHHQKWDGSTPLLWYEFSFLFWAVITDWVIYEEQKFCLAHSSASWNIQDRRPAAGEAFSLCPNMVRMERKQTQSLIKCCSFDNSSQSPHDPVTL